MAKKAVLNPAAGRSFAAGKRAEPPVSGPIARTQHERPEDAAHAPWVALSISAQLEASRINSAIQAMVSQLDDRETRLLIEVRQLHRQVAAQGEQLRMLLGKVQAGVPLSKPPSGRAAAAVAALRAQLSEVPAPDRSAPESVRRRWITEGIVVPTAALVEAWGVTRQALDQARDRSELAGLKVGHRFYYPAAFLQLASSQVATVCRQLGAVDAVNKVIFWTRRHEALEGRTVSEGLQTRKGMEQVLRLAAALSDELSGIALRSDVAVADVHAA